MNKSNNKVRSMIGSYLIIKCLEQASLGWFSSTYVLFLIQRGLSPAQTTEVNTIFMVTNFFFDLPTGALADIVGQLPVYLAGLFVFGITTFLYGLGTNYTHFALSEGSAAVGTSLMSDALEALLTNIVGIDEAKVVMSKEGIYKTLAMIPTALLGSLLAAVYGLQVPWFLSGMTLLIAFTYGTITLRRYHIKPAGNSHKLYDHILSLTNGIKEGVTLIFSRVETRLALVIAATLAFSLQSANMFWAPVLKEQTGSTWWLGFFWVGIALTTACGSSIAEKVESIPKNFGLILTLIGLPLALIVILPRNPIITVTLFLTHEIGRGTLPIILYAYLNKFIPNNQRSSANSARGSVERLFRALGLLAAGILTGYMPLITTWLVSGVSLVLVGIWVISKSRE